MARGASGRRHYAKTRDIVQFKVPIKHPVDILDWRVSQRVPDGVGYTLTMRGSRVFMRVKATWER